MVVPADAEALADVADYCDDRRANDAHNAYHDAYNDARYDVQYDAVPVHAAHPVVRVGAAVRADVAAPVQMQPFLITGINMRIIVFSSFIGCKSRTSLVINY